MTNLVPAIPSSYQLLKIGAATRKNHIMSKKQGEVSEDGDSDVPAELRGMKVDSIEEITRLLDRSGFRKKIPRLSLAAADKLAMMENYAWWEDPVRRYITWFSAWE